MICLVQFLYAEAWPNKRLLTCAECPFRERCKDPAKKQADNTIA